MARWKVRSCGKIIDWRRVYWRLLTDFSKKFNKCFNRVPFNASFLTILTICGTLQISALVPAVGSVLSVLLSLFTYEVCTVLQKIWRKIDNLQWLNLHFSSMTRSRRACFDVANVLETYQPRARTHGHLFVVGKIDKFLRLGGLVVS